MEQRIIPLKIAGERVIGAGVTVGAVGSHDEVLLEMDFRPSGLWKGTTRRAIFSNALGEERTVIILTTDLLAEGQSEVYLVPVPQQAKSVAGECFLTVEGFVAQGEKEVVRCVTEEARFRVLPSKLYYNDTQPVTPTQAEQLQAEIDSIKTDIVEAAKAADAKEFAQEKAQAAAQSAREAQEAMEGARAAQTGAETARDGAQTAQTGAETALTQAQAAQTRTESAMNEVVAQADRATSQASHAQAWAELAESHADRAGSHSDKAATEAAKAQTAQTEAERALNDTRTAQIEAEKARDQAQTAASAAAREAIEEAKTDLAGYMTQAQNAAQSAGKSAGVASGHQAAAQAAEAEATAQADRAAREADRAKQAAGGEFLTAVDIEDKLAEHLRIGEAELMKTMPVGGALFVTDGELPEGLVPEGELDKSWTEAY